MHSKSKKIEIDFRGECIFFTSQIESWLAKIILFIKLEHPELGIKNVDFKNLKFANKIDKVLSLFTKFYPHILLNDSKLFDDLTRVRIFRNRVAHCEFSWDENELDHSYFDIWDIEEDEEKNQFFVPIRYTIQESIAELEHIVNTGSRLLEITRDFQTRFKDGLAASNGNIVS